MESDWNYENDLELVKQKLSTCTPSVKYKIQRLISEILEISFADDSEPPRYLNSAAEEHSKEIHSSLQSDALTPELECLDLDPSLILNVIHLMYQFKKDFQGTKKLLMETEVKNSVTWKLFQGQSLAQLDNLWHVFTIYLQKTVESNEPKSPLELDIVLEIIFGYLPKEEVLKCRLVSRSWNQKLTQWEFPKRDVCRFTLSCDRIVRIMESNITSPFIFSTLNIYLVGMSMDECNWFFTKYGIYVKTLGLYANDSNTLMKTVTPPTSSLFEVISNLRSIFQNVRQLENLKIISISESVLQQPFVFTRQELKSRTLPSIDTLSLDLSCDFSAEFSDGFFTMVNNVNSLNFARCIKPTNEYQQVLKGIQKLKLSSLALSLSHDVNLGDNLLTSIKTQKLKTLEIRFKLTSDEDVGYFEKILESQSQTLEKFTNTNLFYCFSKKQCRKAEFPCMQNLKTLTFDIFGDCVQFDQIEPYQLPELQNIETSFSNISEHFVDCNFKTVEELRENALVEAVDWKTLGSRFPNVKRISVKLIHEIHGNATSQLFCCFPNLEYLNLRVSIKLDCNDYINYLLSGFTKERESIMSQLLATLKSPEELLQIKPEHPSLRDMKKLKELRLHLNAKRGDDKRIVFDNIGIQLGLLSIQPLEQLSIYGRFTISEEGTALLKNYHRNVLISPSAS